MEYLGLNEIRGSLIFVEGVEGAAYDEIVAVKMAGEVRTGRVIQLQKDIATVLVFEGTSGLSTGAAVKFMGRQLQIGLSTEMLGRVLDGMGRPKDGLGRIFPALHREVAGAATNPTTRIYPRNFINTGFSAIDGLATLVRGQKLPIFSAEGLPHDRLAAAIATRASLTPSDEHHRGYPMNADKSPQAQFGHPKPNNGEKFAVVFAAMGISTDTAEYFRRTFTESGQFSRTVMFLNMAHDPPAERLITPRLALTTAEFLAYDHNYHVLVVLTDMTAYAEALREVASARGEIPGRKGFPGYMYSDLASLYERAGLRRSAGGSVTQLPILTMPGDDITHPVPDLTGFITEGQIVLCRAMHARGVFPPVNPLPSLSRLMKDAAVSQEHPRIAARLFANYAAAVAARELAAVVGEEDMSEEEKSSLAFGRKFEEEFLHQGDTARSMDETLKIAGDILGD